MATTGKILDLPYDLEVYPNVFTATFQNPNTGGYKVYEISRRRNDRVALILMLMKAARKGYRAVGFNNWFYDYPVFHHLWKVTDADLSGEEIAFDLYTKSMTIINTPWNNRWSNTVYEKHHLIQQIDLYRVHHFDNVSKSTGLKLLEFNMQMEMIQDLPFPPGTWLTDDEIDVLIGYNKHDVKATGMLLEHTRSMIDFRETLGSKFLNYNDTKIGAVFFETRLEEANVECYEWADGQRSPRQTPRKQIKIRDVIFNYIRFDRPEFQEVRNWLDRQVIKTTKGTFTELPRDSMGELEQYCNMKGPKGTVKNLNCIVDCFQFDFGLGGIHGSVSPGVYETDEDNVIIDIDVTSLYPSIAIANNAYPKHLGAKFVSIYRDLRSERLRHKKGTPENAALKLALNGVYGKSNEKYSPFYDPQYTMTITVNGQLLLCMLAEKVMTIPGLQLIQINTDGLTMFMPRKNVTMLHDIMFDWEMLTGLSLEEVEYSRFFVRDVNNYIGEYLDGKVKRKGTYAHETPLDNPNTREVEWHKNHSALIVPKAAEQALLHGADIREFIENHHILGDTYDFFLRTKVPKTSQLEYGDEFEAEIVQNICRYYISKGGFYLTKIMPPLKGKTNKRYIGVNKNNTVTICNDTTKIDLGNIDYDWYVAEAEALVNPIIGN